MGGKGSSRWWEHQPKLLVEDFPAIDVRDIHRAGLLRPGARFTIRQRRGDGSSLPIAGEVRVGEMLLRWQPAANAPLTAVAVALTETPCTFGGTRPWFLCPQHGLHCSCPGRVARLHIDGLRLGCRRCLRLAYTSQREDELFLAARRARRARRRFGGGTPLSPVPPRPKGMHGPTYIRLRNDAEWADTLFALAVLDDLYDGLDQIARAGLMEPETVPKLPDDVRAAIAIIKQQRQGRR